VESFGLGRRAKCAGVKTESELAESEGLYSRVALGLDIARPEWSRLCPATDAIPLPKLEPRAPREHFVVPTIGGSDVTCAERPYIGRFEHFL
jgi:hypothetical protein